MTKAQASFDKVKRTLVGLPVTHVWRGHGSALFLEFGELTSWKRHDGKSGNPTGEMGLMIEWSWRIEGPRSILCGSWSNEKQWPKFFARMLDARVVDVSIFGRLPEIEVALSNRLYVVSFATVDGQPEWTLFNRRHGQTRWICVKRGVLIYETGS